ncbi:hypothetical protein [Oceanibacterium hippocampi]|uniref:Uncharacterized protein n=1 Tax=Oceanibacterium hippocampi TaxID=745714 RepID=A0A1Y5SUV4_9PROT|nr:hypothetical protein [Oceanibacterium hippocampi]SLN45648.1 hypothetical protein OCH7691_01971 [Oceanibacterium hippocampi]
MSAVAPSRVAFPASDVDALSDNERLLIRSFRHWIIGFLSRDSQQMSLARQSYLPRLGEASSRAARDAMQMLVRSLAGAASRRISYAPPSCAVLSDDEQRLLRLVSACQEGNGNKAEATIVELTGSGPAAPVLAAASCLAAVLHDNDMLLPRYPDTGTGYCPPSDEYVFAARATLH